MPHPQATFTVLFSDPFWIGLYEREENGKYQVCRFPFGAEPSVPEVYDFMLRHFYKLRFSPSLPSDVQKAAHKNLKRMQR